MINTIGVIGLGTMGAGIVEVFAKAGVRVLAVDGSAELAERGKGFLTKSLDRAVSKGKLEESARDEIVGRVEFGDDLNVMKDADLVIEAVPERLDIKVSIFSTLDEIVREDCVLATNTSSLSITEIAKATKHPARVIGMHFFNPAPVLALVEVIHSLLTDPKLIDDVRELAERLGKKPVVVADRAGFVANALLIAYLARSIRHYENGLASREDIDAAMTAGVGFPMGPLTLCDLIGLDVVNEVCEVLFDATRDPSVAAPSLLRQMVAAGLLGRKTGRGFYTYDGVGSGTVVIDDKTSPAPVAFTGKVGLVGVGEIVDELGAELSSKGLDVVRVASADDADNLDGVALTFVVADGDDEAGCACCSDLGDACCDDEGIDGCCGGMCGAAPVAEGESVVSDIEIGAKPLLVAVSDVLGPDAVIAALGEDSVEALLTGDARLDANVVPVVLFEPERAGQILEIGSSVAINAEATQLVRSVAAAAGLTPVVSKDRSGMVVDALLYPHLNDAVKMLDAGYASVSDIDTAMKAGCGYPKGPFELLDELGADEVIEGLTNMYEETGEAHLVPSPLLHEYLMADKSFRG